MPVFDLDFTGDTTETVESGGKPPVGFFLCDLEDVFDDKDDPDKTHFHYVIVQGFVDGKVTDGFNGKKLFDKIDQPAGIEKEDARNFAISKIKIRAHRLGLWDGESAMKSIDFQAAIGTRVVVEQGKRVAKDGPYKGQEFVDVKFDGIYPLTHKKCPACWKQPETTAVPAAAAPSEKAPPTRPATPTPTVPTAPVPTANLWNDL